MSPPSGIDVPSPPGNRLNRIEWLAVLFAVLVAHGYYVHERFYPSSYDALLYVQLGREIAERGLFHHFTGADLRTYGYPFMLSLLVRGTTAVGWPFQFVLFELQFAAYVAACLFFRSALSPIALAAARFAFCGMLANYYVLIYTPESLTESVSLTLLVVAGGCWLAWRRTCAGIGPVVLGSLAVGCALMVRPANMFMVAGWLVGAAVIGMRIRPGRARTLAAGACLLAALVLPMLPQLANNVRNFGKWTPLVVLDLGQMQQTWGIWNIKYATAMPPVPQGAIYYQNPLWTGTVVDEHAPWRWYLDHPGRGLLTVAIHTFNLTDQDLLFTYSRDLDPWYRVPLSVINHAIVALGLLGIFLGVRRTLAQGTAEQRDAMLMLLATASANWAMYCWTAVEMRFGSVLLLVLFPFAGYAAWCLGRARRVRTALAAGAGVAVYVGLALLLSAWVRDQAPLIRGAMAGVAFFP
jgi:hypothetical protein